MPWSVLGGCSIALLAAALLRLPHMWAFLAIVGLSVGVLSLAARDFKLYWLAIYAFALPLELKKLLIAPSSVQEFVLTYGFPIGELPAPVLYLADLPFLVLLLYWGFEIASGKQRIVFPRSHWLAVAFIGWSGISLVNAPSFSSGFFELIRMGKLYLLYLYAANNIRSNETVRTLLKYFMIGVLLQGIICLLQYFLQDMGFLFSRLSGFSSGDLMKKIDPFFNVSDTDRLKRASGTAGAGNAEAMFFEFFLPVAFLLTVTGAKLKGRLLNLAAFVSGIFGTILTFSRGGLIGLAAGLTAVLLLGWRHRFIPGWVFMPLLLAGIFLGIVTAPVAYGYLMTRPEAAMARLHLYKVGWAMIKRHPILGVGLNNHLIVKPRYDPWTYVFQMPTHNHFIIVASQVGIPGLIFFLGFLLSALRSALRAAGASDPYLGAVALGVFGAMFAVLLHVQVDYLGTYTSVSLLWLFCGLAAGLNRTKLEGSFTGPGAMHAHGG